MSTKNQLLLLSNSAELLEASIDNFVTLAIIHKGNLGGYK